MLRRYTLGGECDTINEVLQDYPDIGGLMPGSPDCFGVEPSLELGFWLLALATVLATAAGSFVTQAGVVAIEEHRARAKVAALRTTLALGG